MYVGRPIVYEVSRRQHIVNTLNFQHKKCGSRPPLCYQGVSKTLCYPPLKKKNLCKMRFRLKKQSMEHKLLEIPRLGEGGFLDGQINFQCNIGPQKIPKHILKMQKKHRGIKKCENLHFGHPPMIEKDKDQNNDYNWVSK